MSAGDPAQDAQLPMPSPTRPQVTEPPESPLHRDGHVTAAVLIGIILTAMIAGIVAVFLWRRWRRASAPVAHWAGRSPFADGDLPEPSGERDAADAAGQGPKRTSILALFPWKFGKEEELLESPEEQLSESRETLDDPGGVGEKPSPAGTGGCVPPAGTDTPIPTARSSMTDIPLRLPEMQDLPPPPTWCGDGGASEDLCGPNGIGALPPETQWEALCAQPPDLPPQTLGEASLLPPPPDDFLQPGPTLQPTPHPL